MTDMDDDDDEIRRVNEIIANLPEEDRELMERYHEETRESVVRAAACAIMARNFSHNLGLHCRGVN